jgi:hypothetical protein
MRAFLHTLIASDSCFASGVDHWRVSEEDHLLVESGIHMGRLVATRAQPRAAIDIEDLMWANYKCYRLISGRI